MFSQEPANRAMQLRREMTRDDLPVVQCHRCTMLATHSDMWELMFLMVVEPQAVACELCPARHIRPFPIATRLCGT